MTDHTERQGQGAAASGTATTDCPGRLAAVNLVTDGLASCLTAGPFPTFSWQLAHDGDPAVARQSGYALEVRDAHGGVLWGPDQVSSASQRGIAYGGPRLDDDSDYTWRVQVTDAAGNPGPWSPAQPFSTGLTDGSWQADWMGRAPGGRAPLEVLNHALRVAGSPFLPLPVPALRSVRLDARVRPVMGRAGLLLRSTGAGTGLLVELGPTGEVLLRRAPVWEIPAPAAPDTEVLGRGAPAGGHAADPGSGSWRELTVRDDGHTIRVAVDGDELLAVDEQAAGGTAGVLALHQGPRSQAEYAALRITGSAPGQPEALLLDHRFDAGDDQATACLAHWSRTTEHRQPDEWTLFRTTFQPSGTVRRARLYAAANHHAQLSVAGTRCLATTSFGYPGEGYYDAADITGLFAGHPADTPVPVTALLHWYGPGQGRAAGTPGLLVRLTVDYDDGRRDVLTSGPGWSAGEAPYRQSGYRNDEGDPVEHLDGHAAASLSPAHRLPAAIMCGGHPSSALPRLHPRRTFPAGSFVPPRQFLVAGDGTLVADFGQVLPARPEVDFQDGVPGRTIMLRAGYALRPDGRVDAGKTASQNTDMSFPYTQAAGPQEFRATVHLGFRYLELPGIEPAEVTRVGACTVHGSHPGEGSFSSSDPDLDAVFRLLRDSALYGVQEQFVDTPTREKGQFLADAVNISYATMALFGEHAFTAQALREFAWSAGRYWNAGGEKGRYNAVYPNGDGKRDIPDFSLMLPEWAEEYHLRTGDLALVRELLPHLKDTADYALRHIPADGPTAGLVTTLGGGSGPYLHGIVDWPAPGRFGYDMECAAKTTVNAQAFSALMSTARLCSAAGEHQPEARYQAAAEALARTIRDRLRVDGVMVDGLHADGTPSKHASQHASSFPLSLGITAPGDAAADAGRIAAMGMAQGPMTVHRLVRALAAQGLTDAVLDLLTDKSQPGWARLLERGATFTWEAWDLVEGSDYSQSHAWSASVIKEILEHLLGVRYASPGGNDVVIEPPLCRLGHARGSVPVANGYVHANWRRHGAQVELECTVPPGTTATVQLPGGSYVVAGPTANADTPLSPVPAPRVDGGGGTPPAARCFRVQAGTWTFTPA